MQYDEDKVLSVSVKKIAKNDNEKCERDFLTTKRYPFVVTLPAGSARLAASI
jgi:hypothetical protein